MALPFSLLPLCGLCVLCGKCFSSTGEHRPESFCPDRNEMIFEARKRRGVGPIFGIFGPSRIARQGRVKTREKTFHGKLVKPRGSLIIHGLELIGRGLKTASGVSLLYLRPLAASRGRVTRKSNGVRTCEAASGEDHPCVPQDCLTTSSARSRICRPGCFGSLIRSSIV